MAPSYLQRARRSFAFVSLLACAAIVIAISIALDTRAMQWLENGTYDARVRLLDPRFASEDAERSQRYVVIDIDNASFDQLRGVFGRWPWSRRVWTEVLRYVARGKPKVMAADIIFAGDESPEVDQEFAKVIRSEGNVVLSYLFADTAIETATPEIEELKFKELQGEARPSSFGERKSRSRIGLNIPTESFARAASGLGAINSTPDQDGVIRRIPLQFALGNEGYPSFALKIANVASGRADLFSMTGHSAQRSGQFLPVDRDGRMILLWRNRRLQGARIPLWQVICSIYPAQCEKEVSKISPDFFHDKIVLLAASAAGVYDFHPTPLGEQTPGFIVHLNAVDNILRSEAVREPPHGARIFAVVIMALLGCGVLLVISSASLGTAVAIIIATLYCGAATLAFTQSHWWIPISAPLLGFAVSFVSTGMVRYATTGRELRRTRGTLDRYVSPQLVNYVLENLDRINLAGEKRELTILFSDVRNFTTMTESSDPLELIKTLNEYLAEMTDVIFKYDGITDKFIGDGILAYWGAFTPGKNHAELACRAALEMLERLQVLNERWRAQNRKELAIGIGINTGEVIFGNVGSGKKIEFTVIGDAVNLAARLESQTKEFGVNVIISEFTGARLDGMAKVRTLGDVKVKGKTVKTNILELQSIPAPRPDAP